MDCARCRSLFSDRLEDSLAPPVAEELNAHLAGCPACRRELRQTEKALGLLRSADREEPPPELAQAIIASLDAVPEAENRKGGGIPLGGRLLYGVAALVVLFLLAALILRERSWRQTAGRLQQGLASAQADRDRLVTELDALSSQAGKLRATLSAVEVKLAGAEARSADLEDRLDEVRAAHGRELAGVQEALVASRAETQRLAGEVEQLRVALAERPAEPEKGPEDLEGPGKDSTEKEAPAIARGTGQPRPRQTVFFVDRGDTIELKVRGSREAVIEELFSIAADESNPDTAHLALTALENFLANGVKAVRAAEPPAAGLRAWLDRGVENVTQELGMREIGSDEPVDMTRDRRRVLRELEEAWRRERAGGFHER